MTEEIDYESLWHDEIAERWVQYLYYDECGFDEIQMEITDPNGDVDPDDENFKVKNVIFTINVNGEKAQLWVFYDLENEELHECEDLGNYDFDTEELAKAIYDIDQRLQASIDA
jgi:hypothetical protein